MQEHLVTNFGATWASPTPDFDGDLDQAVADDGVSRLANWYVAGIQWLASRGSAAIDGVCEFDNASPFSPFQHLMDLDLDRCVINCRSRWHRPRPRDDEAVAQSAGPRAGAAAWLD